MSTHVSPSQSKEKKVYIRSSNQWVTVPEDYYKFHIRECDTYRKRMHGRGECICPQSKWWICDMDCMTCEYHTAGCWLSMDTPMETSSGETTSFADTLPDSVACIEEAVSDKILIQALLEALNELDPEGRRMCELFMQGYSEREAAAAMNVARSTFKRHWAAIQVLLADKLKDYR